MPGYRYRKRFLIMSKVSETLHEELAELAKRPENEIDFSDIPPTTENDWLSAERGRFLQTGKRRLKVDIDDDVSEWLERQGGDYQARVNEVLRKAMLKEARPA